MVLKVAAEDSPPLATVDEVVVREYNEESDEAAVEEMERRWEMVGQRGKPSLVTDLLGDPKCRIRHFPVHIMLVRRKILFSLRSWLINLYVCVICLILIITCLYLKK
jgi:hypothetical protein